MDYFTETKPAPFDNSAHLFSNVPGRKYPASFEPESLTEQYERLQNVFGDLRPPNHRLLNEIESGRLDLPEGADEWCVVPFWPGCASIFGIRANEALYKVLGALHQTRGLGDDWREFAGTNTRSNNVEFIRSQENLEEIWKLQERRDTLILAAQFGAGHTEAFSDRKLSAPKEFFLPCFYVGSLILGNPSRFETREDLAVDSLVEAFFDEEGTYVAPTFFVDEKGELRFRPHPVSKLGRISGSVTAFTTF